MRKGLALLLALLLLGGGALAESTLDYTVADKLQKQLEAGSGFTGTLTLESAAAEGRQSEAIITQKPLSFDVGYINIRANEAQQIDAEKRLTLTLKDGEEEKAALEACLKNGNLYLNSELLGQGWLALGGGSELVSAAQGAASGLPALTALLPTLLLPATLQSDELSALLTPYLTKLDLWLEGYRQETALGKTEAGETTMSFRYAITPPAIKSQLKQMALDVMSDAPLLTAAQALLTQEQSALYLNPALLSYYFTAINDLPLQGDISIARTVSLKGDTLRLEIALPLRDADAGDITVGYLRAVGDGDIPASQEITLQSDSERITFRYQGYHTMTDTTVYQGSLTVQPQAEGAATSLDAAFTLTHQVTASTEGEDTDVMTHDVTLQLEPRTDEAAADATADPAATPAETPIATPAPSGLPFGPVELHAVAAFRSRKANDAATYMDVTATLTGEELAQTITLTLSGRSSKPWSPMAFDETRTRKLGAMDKADRDALLLNAGTQAAALLLPFVTLPASLLKLGE